MRYLINRFMKLHTLNVLADFFEDVGEIWLFYMAVIGFMIGRINYNHHASIFPAFLFFLLWVEIYSFFILYRYKTFEYEEIFNFILSEEKNIQIFVKGVGIKKVKEDEEMAIQKLSAEIKHCIQLESGNSFSCCREFCNVLSLSLKKLSPGIRIDDLHVNDLKNNDWAQKHFDLPITLRDVYKK